MSIKYHPKMLKIFTKSELDLLEKEAAYSVDKNGCIDVMVVSRDKIIVEIFTDCEAADEEHALISILYDCGYEYPNPLEKDDFWNIYLDSKPMGTCSFVLDE